MWNHIRGPPFSHRNHQTGQVVSKCRPSHSSPNGPYATVVTLTDLFMSWNFICMQTVSNYWYSLSLVCFFYMLGVLQWNKPISVHCWDIHCNVIVYPLIHVYTYIYLYTTYIIASLFLNSLCCYPFLVLFFFNSSLPSPS